MSDRDALPLPSDGGGTASRWLRALSHGPHLVVISAIMVIAATWASIGYHVYDQKRASNGAAEQELRGAILTLGSHARRTIEAVNTTLHATDAWLYEASRDTRSTPLGELALLIDAIQKSSEEYIDIRPISNDGYLFRFAAGDTFRTFVGDRSYILKLQDAEPGEVVIAEPVESRDSGRYVLPIAMKVRANRYGIGYLVAAVTLEQFERAYKDLLISAKGRIGIARDDGAVVVSVPRDLLGEPDAARAFVEPMLATATSEPTMFEVTSPITGGPVMAAALHLQKQPILVYAAFERQELDQRWRDGALPQFVAGAVVTLLTLLIAGWLRYLMHQKDREAANTAAALEEANAANVAKRQFLAHMSHELRTPLNAILGFSEVISHAMFGPIEANYRTYGTDINKSGNHLLHLVDQLLDISRIESGAIELVPQPCNLADLVQEALRIVEPYRSSRRVTVSVDLAEDATTLVADRGTLRQVLINLLSNAARYNRDQGSIAVTSRTMGDRLVIAVEDTGQGIAAADLAQVFEPFKKGDAHVAQAADAGFGLGLPIVRGKVELMGGEIRLQSTHGVGTRVEIHLPRARLDQAELA